MLLHFKSFVSSGKTSSKDLCFQPSMELGDQAASGDKEQNSRYSLGKQNFASLFLGYKLNDLTIREQCAAFSWKIRIVALSSEELGSQSLTPAPILKESLKRIICCV